MHRSDINVDVVDVTKNSLIQKKIILIKHVKKYLELIQVCLYLRYPTVGPCIMYIFVYLMIFRKRGYQVWKVPVCYAGDCQEVAQG